MESKYCFEKKVKNFFKHEKPYLKLFINIVSANIQILVVGGDQLTYTVVGRCQVQAVRQVIELLQ